MMKAIVNFIENAFESRALRHGKFFKFADFRKAETFPLGKSWVDLYFKFSLFARFGINFLRIEIGVGFVVKEIEVDAVIFA